VTRLKKSFSVRYHGEDCFGNLNAMVFSFTQWLATQPCVSRPIGPLEIAGRYTSGFG
jgi:hypothetical protein